APGTRVQYSCTNYYLLARVIETISGQPLRRFVEERLIAPLGLRNTTFEPLTEYSLDRIAPTEIEENGGLPWHGVVHDEAARSWQRQTGGACGNAGLFSTAADLARFGRMWLDGGALENGAVLLDAEDARRTFTDVIPETHNLRGWR